MRRGWCSIVRARVVRGGASSTNTLIAPSAWNGSCSQASRHGGSGTPAQGLPRVLGRRPGGGGGWLGGISCRGRLWLLVRVLGDLGSANVHVCRRYQEGLRRRDLLRGGARGGPPAGTFPPGSPQRLLSTVESVAPSVVDGGQRLSPAGMGGSGCGPESSQSSGARGGGSRAGRSSPLSTPWRVFAVSAGAPTPPTQPFRPRFPPILAQSTTLRPVSIPSSRSSVWSR